MYIQIVRVTLIDNQGDSKTLIGASLGGGKISILQIEDIEVNISGDFDTLITEHHDEPGVIAEVASIMSKWGLNIAFMKLYRETKGEHGILVLELDDPIPNEVIEEIRRIPIVYRLTAIRKWSR